MRRLLFVLVLLLALVAPLFAQTLITQAMVSAGGPGGYVITAPGEYEIAETILFPYAYGYAIQNSVAWNKSPITIRNPRGRRIINTAGPATQATGIGIYGTSLRLYGVNIESFRTAVAARCPPGDLSVGGEHQVVDCLFESSWYSGLILEGHDSQLRHVCVRVVGGGSGGASRPIGLQIIGDRPRFDGVSVHDVIRGSADTETMHMHLDRSTGARGRLRFFQRERQALSFGVWFNACYDARLDLVVDNVDTAVANELWSGRLTGQTINVSVTSTLPTTGATTPTVALN